MKKRYGILKSIVGFVLSVSLLAPSAAAVMPALKAEAASKNTVVTYEYYTTNLGHVIPSSWLFVGTYLMSAKSLTAEMYQAALDSREYYNQTIAYYSSELDGGAWKNIEGASSITNILPVAEKVSEKDLYPYLVSVVVDDDGIPKDPVTEEPIDIYTHISLYDMENIPELSALYEYYLSGDIGWEDEGSKNYLYRMLYFFFENDDLYFDRVALDAGVAYDQFKVLVQDRAQLEKIWDQSLTTTSESWPAEYKEIMTVMRNWPNIRDDITDRADREEEILNTLFMSLQEKELTEEADAALYVERQIDAARRAEIYYNLTQNENLTGSYGVAIDKELEALELEDAELKAYIAQLALDIDKAEAPIKAARSAIYELEDANEANDAAIAKEEADFEAKGTEEKLDKLKTELAAIKADTVDVVAEYERLDAALDEALNMTVSMNDAQTAINDEIEELTKLKTDKQTEYDEKIAALEKALSGLKTRKTIAEGRKSEYEEAVNEKEELEDELERLYATIETEEDKLDKLKKEADTYTSSRTTADADVSKIYDPKKKQEADRNLEKQEKLLSSLSDTAAALESKNAKLTALVNEIYGDLHLDDEIKQAQKALDDAKETLKPILDKELADITLEVGKRQDQLAAMSDPYQEKLNALKKANDAYDAYLDTYQAAKARIDGKQLEIMAVEEEIELHDKLIASYDEKTESNKALIRTKELTIVGMQAHVDALVDDHDLSYEKEQEIAQLIKGIKDGSVSPYDARVKACEALISLISDRKAVIEKEIAQLEEADKELARDRELKLVKISEAEKYREETAAAEYEENKSSIEDKYGKMLDELAGEEADTKEQMRQSLLDYEKAASEDLNILSIDASLQNAQTEAANALAFKDAVADYKLAEADLTACQKKYDEAKKKYEKTLNGQSTMRGRVGGLNYFYLAKLDMENAAKRLEEAGKKASELKVRIDSLAEQCSDYTGSIYNGSQTEQYYETKQREAQRLQSEVKAAKDAFDEGYRILSERWENKISELEKRIQETVAQKEATLTAAADEFKAAMEEKLDGIEEMEESCNELAQKRADIKVEINNKKNNIEYLISETEKYRMLQAEYEAKQVALREAGNFGVAPTLRFLKDASENGKPDMGRRFEDISAYSGMGGYVETTEVTNLIQDAYTACMASYESYMKKSMQRGETAADYTGYILSRRVASTADNESACMPYLQMIVDLNHIEAGETEHAQRETQLLYNWLIPFAIIDFNEKRSTAAMEIYHYYLSAVTDRDTAENGIVYIEDRLEYARSLKSSFTAGGKQDLIETHILFLEGLLAALRSRTGDDKDKEVSDYEQELIDERDRCIEDNELSRAKLIDALLQGLTADREFEDDEAGGNDGDSELEPTEPVPGPYNKPETEVMEVICDTIATENKIPEPDIQKLAGLNGDLGDLLNELDDSGISPEYSNRIAEALKNEFEGNGLTGSGDSYTSGEGSGGHGGGSGSGTGSGTSGGEDGSGTGSNTGTGTGTGSGTSGGEDGSGTGSNTGTGTGIGSSSSGGAGSAGSAGGGSGSVGKDIGDGKGDNEGGDSREPGGGAGYGDGVSRLDKGKVKDAVKPLFDGSGPEAQAAIVAALAEAAQQKGNSGLNDLSKELLDELMRNANSFIYRQYMNDNSREYVSLAALDKCRRQSGFRYVRKGMNVTISQLYQGSASYIFTVGSSSMIKNNGEEVSLKVKCVEQNDRYIRGNSSAKYAYIDENDSYKYTGCDCVYIRTTDWAVLVTPGMQKTMKEVAEIMNEMADRGELEQR